ncbi:MAG: hypothetical protein PHU43_04605 [Candidatus Bipolaricaulis sp.]|nr:hypothetical protein [Candidatus Bipolaricaulis sp.]
MPFPARWFANHGPGCFARLAAETIAANGWPVAAISGIRSAADVRLLKAAYGESFLLVHVLVSDDSVRLDRMAKRAEARDPKDAAHFRELDRREEELFRISEAITIADHTIANDDTLADLHAAIDRIVIKASLLQPGNRFLYASRAPLGEQGVGFRHRGRSLRLFGPHVRTHSPHR